MTTPRAKISIFTSHNSEMHKHYTLDTFPKGKASANMYKGIVETVPAETPQQLLKTLKDLKGNQALSTFRNLTDKSEIVKQGSETETAISRTLDYFGTVPSEQLVVADYDFKDEMPENLKLSPPELIAVINDIFGTPRMLIGCGGSALVVKSDDETTTNDLVAKPTSTHIYLWLSNGSKIPEFTKYLNYQLAKRGLVWAKIYKNGNVKIEHLFDNAPLTNHCTLIFEATPTCDNGLRVLDNWHDIQEGGIIDSDSDFELTSEQATEYETICRDLAKSVETEATKIHIAWAKAKGKELKEKGLTPAKIKKVLEGRTVAHEKDGRNNLFFLSPYDEIKTEKGLFKVSEIITNKAKFHRVECVDVDDVDDPQDCERYRAIIRFDADDSVTLFSRASGDKMYILKHRKAQMPTDFIPMDKPIPNFGELAPHTKLQNDEPVLLNTRQNFELMLKLHGVKLEYNIMLRKKNIIIPNNSVEGDLKNEADLSELVSLCNLNLLNPRAVENYTSKLFADNEKNYVIDFIQGQVWDGIDRLKPLFETITLAHKSDYAYGLSIFKTWLIQCVAAADAAKSTPLKNAKSKYESVLVFASSQGGNKSDYFENLTPPELRDYFSKGQTLVLDDKDSRFEATSYWIVELGELDATFRKSDIAGLKAFLSLSTDTQRRPYDKVANDYRRRTSFCGSVNDANFLHDVTGNRRYLPLEIIDCNKNHDVDMAQVWAQVWGLYIGGEKWWFDKDDAMAGEVLAHQRGAMNHDPIIEEFIQWYGGEPKPEHSNTWAFKRYTVKGLIQTVKGVKTNHNGDCIDPIVTAREIDKLRAYLNEREFKSSKSDGVMKYSICTPFLSLKAVDEGMKDEETDKILEKCPF